MKMDEIINKCTLEAVKNSFDEIDTLDNFDNRCKKITELLDYVGDIEYSESELVDYIRLRSKKYKTELNYILEESRKDDISLKVELNNYRQGNN